MQVGLLILVLLIAQIWWRRTHTPPQLPPEVGEISRRVSNPAHLLIYALMLAPPLVGIVALVWHARAFEFGLFSIDFGVKANRAVYERAEDIHLWSTYGLFGLVAGHGVAALWHLGCLRLGPGEKLLTARHITRHSPVAGSRRNRSNTPFVTEGRSFYIAPCRRRAFSRGAAKSRKARSLSGNSR
jgi:hypothetical protein